MVFCLNGCVMDSLSIIPEETGCAGRFCDKQRVIEVWQYNQGCACYSCDSRRTNMVIDHALNIHHHDIQDVMHVENYSSISFSLLYQTAVFSSQVWSISLNLTDKYFELEDSVTNMMELVNNNGRFTVIGWYKRGNIADRTIVFQNKNSNKSSYASVLTANDTSNQVNSSKVIFHPCVVKPTNPNFFDTNDPLKKNLMN